MKKNRILIIEDDKWLGEHWSLILGKAGFEVTLSGDAEQAIGIIDANLPDLIVLDVLLTGTTAFNLLHELNSYNDTRFIPVIICSNLADSLSLDSLIYYGVKQVLDKTTMKPADLIAAISSELS